MKPKPEKGWKSIGNVSDGKLFWKSDMEEFDFENNLSNRREKGSRALMGST